MRFIALLLSFAAFSANADELKPLEFYGFILANSTTAVNGVDSLGRNNSVAYNSAANPALAAFPSRTTNTFQLQQTRFGLKANIEKDLQGLAEFDFVDFSKSTPTVSSQPRLRRAKIMWKEDEWTFNVGQDWDLVSPLGPSTYNYIGHYFLSGDIGFMRLQAQALYKSGDYEHAMAIGFPNFNNQTAVSTAEFSDLPTLSLRETISHDAWTYGASGIISRLELVSRQRTQTPFATTVFVKHQTPEHELNFESYYGHNLENLSLQALSYSASLLTLKEAGTYLTYKQKVSEKQKVFFGLGYAKILNDKNLDPSYTAGTGGKLGTLNLLTSSTGYGIVQNATARVGYEYFLREKLNFFFETAFLYTEHKLQAVDTGRFSSFRNAQVFEIGFKLDI